MAQYPINRLCPLTGQPAVRTLGHIPAGLVQAGNPTYRPNALEILGVGPDDEFPIVEGPTGFVFAGWLPDEAFLRRVYEDAIDHEKTQTAALPYRRALLEFGAAFLALKQRDGLPGRPLKLLDYGCGYGDLLRILASRDIVGIGFEPSTARREHSQEHVEVLRDLEEVAQRGPYDLIVCTEVLEHLPEPRVALQFFRSHAAPGALLAITVPNCLPAFVSQAMSGFRAGAVQPAVFNPWEHLNYFHRQNLDRTLNEAGFSIVGDFGRTRDALDALTVAKGDSALDIALNSLRIAKRLLSALPSTEIFCRCSNG